MSLIDIRSYLQGCGEATLSEIAAYFSSDPETTRGMLEVWQRKGRVVCQRAPRCSGCNQCNGAAVEVYRWQV